MRWRIIPNECPPCYRFASPRRITLNCLVVVFIALIGSPALADISKCVDAEGNITYTDAGCPEGAQEVDKIHEIPSAEAKKLRPKVPLKDRLRGLLTMDNIPQWGSRYGIWALYGLMSAFSLMAIVRDKRQSLRGQWRTSERRLHLLELLGGWPGSLIAQQALRHKTGKLSYQLTFWSIVALHGLVWADFLHKHTMSRAVLDLINRFR
jgi:uncharacterized membrane protein YsdA (DUF1294 family)